MGETYLSPLTATDGDNIAVQDWPLEPGEPQRGTVIIVHGLGEHAGRYAQVAADLNSWGYAARSYDQVGHGDSGGARGSLPHAMRMLDDLADVVDSTRRRMAAQERLILLGHSMGGVVAGQFVLRRLRRVDGLILSSPALQTDLNPLQKLLMAIVPRWLPDLTVGNGLKLAGLCRDPAVVAAYQKDPLVHNRICARLAQWIGTQGACLIAAAPQWPTPTLLVYAGADTLVNPAGSRAFAMNAPSKMLQAQCFEAMYHEILNDPQRDQVLAVVRQWLGKK